MPDRKLDDVTLAIFGDTDAGYGLTYSEITGEDSEDDWLAAECDLNWADFNFGKKQPK